MDCYTAYWCFNVNLQYNMVNIQDLSDNWQLFNWLSFYTKFTEHYGSETFTYDKFQKRK